MNGVIRINIKKLNRCGFSFFKSECNKIESDKRRKVNVEPCTCWCICIMPYYTGCPKKHGSHNINMSARAYFKKRVIDCKDVSIMFPQDEQ